MKHRSFGIVVSVLVGGLAASFVGCGGADVPSREDSPSDDDSSRGTNAGTTSDDDDDRHPGSGSSDDSGKTPGGDSSPDASSPPSPPPTVDCSPDPSKSKYSAESVDVGGQKRTYHLFVPAPCDANQPRSIVVLYHGDGGFGEQMRGLKFEDRVGGNAVVVYPDGVFFTWDTNSAPANNKDIQFFDALLGDVAKKATVDPSRVFVFGHSRGAFFVNLLGCYRGNNVRALVAHSGGGPSSSQKDVCNTPPPAAMMIHGDADPNVSYDSGKKSLQYWMTKNKCQSGTTPFDPSPCVSYDGCTAGHPVVWCSLPGAGHGIWSSATEASWNFFRQF